MLLSVLLGLLLVGCQNEEKTTKVDDQNDKDKLAVDTANRSLEYEWKTNYTYILDQYISNYGFMNIEINPFTDYNYGVAAAKVIYAKDREVPYLAILYATDLFVQSLPTAHEEEAQLDGVYFDIWDIQDGMPVRITHDFHSHQGTGGDLGVAFVETTEGETLIRYTSRTHVGEFNSFDEKFYIVNDLEKPVHHLVESKNFSEARTFEHEFYVNGEVSESKYLKQREHLNYKELQWIESSAGDKSIADNVSPVIPNVLAIFESLNTQQLQAPKELLPIEEQEIFNNLLDFELFEDNLTEKGKIEFANAIYAIKGATYSEDYFYIYYSKEAMDYYSKSNFDFILDETTFASKPVHQTPAYKDGIYIYPVLGDYGIFPQIYVLDLLNIEKVDDSLYMVQFEEAYYDPYLHMEAGFNREDWMNSYLPKSKWPKDSHEFMFKEQTKYALFKKNKYGFALLEKSSEPITNLTGNRENQTQSNAMQIPPKLSDKDRYLESVSYAEKLYDETTSADVYKLALLEAHDAWDDELNKIYRMLREKLPTTEMEQLKLEQRAWIKERDADAGNPEETGVITHWEVRLDHTRERTYYLIDLYFKD